LPLLHNTDLLYLINGLRLGGKFVRPQFPQLGILTHLNQDLHIHE
jgi:hypothetical protein